jgi:hypothetical protein
MMRKRTLIGAGLAAALAGAMLLYQSPISAQPFGGQGMMGGYGPGYGHMGGYGPGMMGGYGGGYGMMGGWGGGGQGPWNGPAFGQGGPGSADGQGPGFGPGFHMRGWGGGPGMMQGYGPGYDRSGNAQGNQPLNLTTDDVKSRVERWLAWRGNQRLKLGEVKEKDADTITADVVTKDNSLVQRFIVDRHTGFTRQDNG